MKEKFNRVISEHILPFHVYDHLCFCDRDMKSSCNFCSLGIFKDREVFTIVRDRLTFGSDLFWNKFTELVFVV